MHTVTHFCAGDTCTPCVLSSIIMLEITDKGADQFQLSLTPSEATSNVQDFHAEPKFLLWETEAYKGVIYAQGNIELNELLLK